MKKLIAVFAMSMALSATAAQSIDTSKLTPEQVATLSKQVQEMTKEPVSVSASVRKEAEAWGELGANMGKAMVGAAKEVGVAANEFSQTPLGQVVVFMAAYKIVGHEMLGIVIGTGILLFGYSLAIWILLTRRWSAVKYEYEPVLWGLFKRQRIVSCNTDNDVVTGRIVSGLILIALTTVVGLNTIF